MLYIHNKNGKIIYNNEIKTIKYIKRKFLVGTTHQVMFTSDLLFTTMSRDNLLGFTFWSSEQKMLLNSVSIINAYVISNIINSFIIYYNTDLGTRYLLFIYSPKHIL